MKNDRQSMILEIISQENIETQEQLLVRLQERGITSTQATISRDIKQMHLIKEPVGHGVYKYAVSGNRTRLNFAEKLRTIFRESITSIDSAQNIVVIKTMPGLASAACAALAADLKIGAVMLGDETEGYTLAHMEGIKQAAAELGLSDSIVWKYKVPEDQTCYDSALDLVGQGCNLIISNSYGHQSYMALAAEEYPDVTFVAMTGDFAALSGLDNLKNAFTKVYQSRYVSGVVAGMKLAEMLGDGTLSAEKQPNSFDADGNVKIGYVGAYNYAEVVSGYTAFFLGIRSIVPNVTMEVMYTNSWFDIDKEGAAAEALVAKGCVIIGQHADSTGAPSAVQAKYEAGETVFSVGYNIDMLSVAPDVALTSPQNNWGSYYTYAFEQVMNGKNNRFYSALP